MSLKFLIKISCCPKVFITSVIMTSKKAPLKDVFCDSPEIPTWVKGNGMVCQSHEDHQEERKMNIRINCKRDRISVRSRRSMSPHKYNACSRITRESPYASQSWSIELMENIFSVCFDNRFVIIISVYFARLVQMLCLDISMPCLPDPC